MNHNCKIKDCLHCNNGLHNLCLACPDNPWKDQKYWNPKTEKYDLTYQEVYLQK